MASGATVAYLPLRSRQMEKVQSPFLSTENLSPNPIYYLGSLSFPPLYIAVREATYISNW
jgi:hypothetical protein